VPTPDEKGPEPTGTPYAHWLTCYELAWLNPTTIGRIACPECGGLHLNLEFEVYSPESTSCMAWLWCSTCLQGIGAHAPIPATIVPSPQGTLKIPSFTLIPPDCVEGESDRR
jgi:hypothetical protein